MRLCEAIHTKRSAASFFPLFRKFRAYESNHKINYIISLITKRSQQNLHMLPPVDVIFLRSNFFSTISTTPGISVFTFSLYWSIFSILSTLINLYRSRFRSNRMNTFKEK